jgi:NTP pyrophosphatase (non-canonical NTP hydrolase)
MARSSNEDSVTFTSFIEAARSTEIKPTHMIADWDFLQRLIEFSASASALVDLYKKSFYNNEPISADSFELRLGRVRDSIAKLQVSPQSTEFVDARNTRLFLAMIGIFTEAGELVESTCPINSDVNYTVDSILEELGDLNWYQAIAMNELHVPLETVLAMNVAKLRARYRDKRPGQENDRRDTAAEQAAMRAIDLPTRDSDPTSGD